MTIRFLDDERKQRTHTFRTLTPAEQAESGRPPQQNAILVARMEKLPHERAGEPTTLEFSLFDRSSNEGTRHPATGRELVDPEMRAEISTGTGEIIHPLRERIEQGVYELRFVPPEAGTYTLALYLPNPVSGRLEPQRFHFYVSPRS